MRFGIRLGVLAALGLGIAFWVDAADSLGDLAPERIDRPAEAHRPAARTVLLISIDGLAPRVLAAVRAPTLERLAREGARARVARTGQPPSTLPSHASMISGLTVEEHGVDWNSYRPWSRVEVRTLFDACAGNGLRCGLFAGKSKFAHLAEHEPGVERYVLGADAAAVLDAAAAWLAERSPDFALIHLAEVDRAGHGEGWDGPAQRAAVEALDARLGAFLERAAALARRPLAVIVTADHGGEGHGHRGTEDAVVEIPWIAWGDGVPPGELGEVSIRDTAPAVLRLLGVEASLGSGARAPF